MHKSATKCNKTVGKWCKNKHGASKIIDTLETYQLHEDDDSIFSSFNSKFDKRYQVLAIVGDNSEELDENNNPVLNPANINRGANHLAEGETADSLASREKI
jgi:hypothetical protein